MSKTTKTLTSVFASATQITNVRPMPSPAGAEPVLNDPSVRMYLDMLSYCRPAGSKTEDEFVSRYLRARDDTMEDGYGNQWVTVDNPDGTQPNIMWSSHTDTVHHEDGYQKVFVGDGKVFADKSSCLGGDDTTGVWLMLEMIKARVPGLYIFHREEEIGGHGSTYIAKNYAAALEGIDCAIALDRKGYSSVITKMGSRTCSDVFATSLALALGAPGDYAGEFEPDDTGLFTDTSHYTGLVGECSNLSVGYFKAHSPDEYQDLRFMVALRDRLCSADFSELVFERKPGEADPDWSSYSYGSKRASRDARDMYEFVFDNTEVVQEFLEEMGMTLEDMLAYKDEREGLTRGDDKPPAWDEDDAWEQAQYTPDMDEIAFDDKGNIIKLRGH